LNRFSSGRENLPLLPLLNDSDDRIADGREHFGLERSNHSSDQGFVGREDFAGAHIADVL
jgi:hypothetical protein